MLNRTRTSTLDAFGLRDQRNRIYPALTGSDGSTLSLDFTAMSGLDSRFTFSRSSPATLINSSGRVQFANANMIRNSENCALWSGSQNITPTSDAAIAPDGTQTADQLNLASGSYRYQTTSTTNAVGASYVGSIWMRTVSGTASVGFRIANNTTGSNSSIATCNVTETWQRFNTPAFTLTDTANRGIDIGIDQRSIVSGPNVAANIYVWGLQLQPGASVGEYLPTTTTENYSVPRFDYDPSTLAPRGLLIEGSATNLVTRSDVLDDTGNISWLVSGMTRSSSTQVSPTGNSETVALVSGNGSFRSNNVTVTASTTYTFSFWAKNNSGTQARYRVWNASAGSSIVDYSQSSSNYVSQLSNTAWTRISVTFTTPVGCTSIFVYPCSSDTTGTNVYLWGAQLEASSVASSYIPTGTSTVQRAADSCTMTGTNFSSWFNAGAAYSMLFRYSLNNPTAWAGTNIDRACGQLSVSGSGNRTFINAAYRVASGSGDIGRYVRIFDLGTLDMQPATLPAAASNTALAFAVNTNDAAVSAANQSLGTDSACTILTGQNQLDIGHVGSAQHINGCISLIKYWPQRLSNAQLQAITT